VPLRLRPIRDDELPAFIEHGKAQYARDMIEHAGLDPELAQKKTDQDWARLLPNGQAPAGHHLYVVEDEVGQRVGDLWFAERSNDFDGTGAFVYSIEIAEEFRGKGYGRETMELLEDEVRAAGLDRISLNVFGGNEVARSLYRSLGYAETAVMMRKELRTR
jgi:ribosomal protein S18 acetylase RimI-like enzyme